jgi:hypothetical protein
MKSDAANKKDDSKKLDDASKKKGDSTQKKADTSKKTDDSSKKKPAETESDDSPLHDNEGEITDPLEVSFSLIASNINDYMPYLSNCIALVM